MLYATLFVISTLLTAFMTYGHPGHDVSEEAAERAEFFRRSPRTVQTCSKRLRARGHENANLKRRQALAAHIRANRGLSSRPQLVRRDFSTYNHSHLSNDTSLSLDNVETDLFTSNSNTSCTLQPEVTQGPYYINGELIRSNVTETQAGVPLTLDIQIIDTATCSPIPALFLEIWHCNTTGVYSGVVSSGNGNQNDSSNLDNTFLRGIQQTDLNGIVQFHTIFPGHYLGRATHIHVLNHNPNDTTVRLNDTLLARSTSKTSNATTVHANHVGQLFFDQSLISAVETTSPYSTNIQNITVNSDDEILATEAATVDPFAEYIMLGDKIEDGILAWITIAIDSSLDSAVTSAGTFYEDGGVANDEGGGEFGGGGQGGAPPLNMTAVASGTVAAPSASSTFTA